MSTFADSTTLLLKLSKHLHEFTKYSNPEAISVFRTAKVERTTLFTGNITADRPWFGFFLSALCEVTPAVGGKQKFVEECRRYYLNNPSVLKAIDEFDTTYEAEYSVWWYTREGFLYRILNCALRKQHQASIELLHFFIFDLYHQLACEYQKVEGSCPRGKLYRGQLMTKDELKILQEKTDYSVLVNSFLSTTYDRDVALIFAGARAYSQFDSVQSVLFEIPLEHWLSAKPFADVQWMSFSQDESEILFTPGTLLSPTEVTYDETERTWLVQVYLQKADSGLPIHINEKLIKLDLQLRNLNEDETSHKEDFEFTELFNKFIVSTASNYSGITDFQFSTLIVKRIRPFRPRMDIYATMYDCLGTIHKNKGDFKAGLEWFNRANQVDQEAQLNTTTSIRLINIAGLHKLCGDHVQAWLTYEQFMERCDSDVVEHDFDPFEEVVFASRDDCDTSNTFENYLLNCEQFLSYLSANPTILDKNWPRIKDAYVLCARSWEINVKDFEMAQASFQKALDIVQQNGSDMHRFLAECYQGLGSVHHHKNELDLALAFYKQVINENYADDCIEQIPCDIALAHAKIGQIHGQKKESTLAWSSFHDSFQFWLTIEDVHDDLAELAESYLSLAIVYSHHARHSDAVDAYRIAARYFIAEDKNNDEKVAHCCEMIISEKSLSK